MVSYKKERVPWSLEQFKLVSAFLGLGNNSRTLESSRYNAGKISGLRL